MIVCDGCGAAENVEEGIFVYPQVMVGYWQGNEKETIPWPILSEKVDLCGYCLHGTITQKILEVVKPSLQIAKEKNNAKSDD